MFSSQGIINISFPITDVRTRRSEIPTTYKLILIFVVIIISAYVLLLPVATVSLAAAHLVALTGSNFARLGISNLRSACRIWCVAGASFDFSLLDFHPTAVNPSFVVTVVIVISTPLVFRPGPSIVGSLYFLCDFLILVGVIDMCSLFCVLFCIGLLVLGRLGSGSLGVL